MAKRKVNQDEKSLNYKFYVVNLKVRHLDTTEELTSTEYSQLFREFYEAEIQGQSSKQKECALITRVEQEIRGREPAFWGQLVEVTKINNGKWFNKFKRAIDTSFKVPNEYAANAKITEYVFIPAVHRFCYQFSSKNYINPYSVKAFLQKAFGELFAGRYITQVDVENDNSTIQKILDAPNVEKLWVKINYSNNDFAKEVQKFVENDLKISNIGEMEIKAVKKGQSSIDVSKSRILTGALQTSRSNGEAEATIINENGRKEKVKTHNSPNRISFSSTVRSRIVDLYKIVINEFRKSQL